MRLLLVLRLTGCSAPPPAQATPAKAQPDAPTPTTPPTASGPALHWYAGDLHMHVTPPDGADDVQMSVSDIAVAARDAKLDFVVLTPHLWPSRWGASYRKTWSKLASDSRAERGLTLIPGIEWSTRGGHFTVTGVDLEKLAGNDVLSAAHAAGA